MNTSQTSSGSSAASTSNVASNPGADAGASSTGTTPQTSAPGSSSSGTTASNTSGSATSPASGFNSDTSTVASTDSPAPSAAPIPITADAAARFLQQASWGATAAQIAHVQQIGFSAYLDEQFLSGEDSYSDPNFQWVSSHFLEAAAYHDQSQLRTKVGWAWYKLFNSPGTTVPGMLSSLPNLVQRDSFGSFTTLLQDVSLNIEMGFYLTYCCGDNANSGPQPDENFAREILQQFSLGPYQLNSDGSPQLGSDGSPVPSYTLADIRAIARSMTGLTYDQSMAWNSLDPEGLTPMASGSPAAHDSTEKTVLGQTVPSGMDAATEVMYVDKLLAEQDTTGRHLSAYLIHELVTSNPSSEYVARIASVWSDDGHGVKGNLQAVVKAVLLDSEARAGDATASSYDFGRMRDTVNFATTVIRVFGAYPHPGVPLTGFEVDLSNLSHETVFSAPSVFGYYSASYGLAGTNLLAPEAQLYTADAINARAQFTAKVFGIAGLPNSVDPSVDWAAWLPLAAGDGSALIDQLNHLCFHGQMSSDLASVLSSNLQQISSTDLLTRVQQTSYLAVMAPEFAAER